MLRNFISITGITQENQLPKKIRGELVEHSDIDYIFIPSSRPKAKTINHVAVSVELINQRVIKAPTGTVIVLDGVKKLKITYSPLGHSRKNIQLELSLPYNTFIELPEGVEKLNNIDIFIADAYFELVEGRKIYNYTFYILDVDYAGNFTVEDESKESNEDPSLEETEEIEKMEDIEGLEEADEVEAPEEPEDTRDSDEFDESYDDLEALGRALLLFNEKKDDEEKNNE